MRTSPRHVRATILLAAGLVAASAGVIAKPQRAGELPTTGPSPPDVIWRDPGPIASLDMTYGAGGKARAPAGPFTFVDEDAAATSPKFEVTDARGVVWKVKLGDESQAETAATRFLWAAGYPVDDVYFLGEMTVAGLPDLKRGREFISAGGVVRSARLERKRPAGAKIGDWDWFDNPFVGRRELNGLRVMMSLLNSWDLKRMNNAIYLVGGELHYVVSDLGGTFGQTGDALTRTKGVPEDYDKSPFVGKVRPTAVDFLLYSRPTLMSMLDVPNYRERTRIEQITRRIPRDDVRWLARRLSGLTTGQVRDGFRAAGYSGADLDTLTRVMQRRIAALGAL